MDIPCLVPQLNHREKTLPLDPPTPAHVLFLKLSHKQKVNNQAKQTQGEGGRVGKYHMFARKT